MNNITILDLEHVTGGRAAAAFSPDSANQSGFSFIRAGRNWKVGQNGSVVGTIGNNQRVEINGDHASVQHDGPFPGGHRFNHNGSGWQYSGSTR